MDHFQQTSPFPPAKRPRMTEPVPTSQGKGLIEVATEGNIKGVIDLLENISKGRFTISINDSDKYGRCAIHYSAYFGHTVVTKLLLEQPGIDVNKQDRFRMTPLMLAVLSEKLSVVKILVEHAGIDVNKRNDLSQTALIIAGELGLRDIFAALIRHPSIKNFTLPRQGFSYLPVTRDEDKDTIIDLLEERIRQGNVAARFAELLECAKSGSAQRMQALIAMDSEMINWVDTSGLSALHHAASCGNLAVAQALIQNPQVDINLTDKFGRTPLLCAIDSKQEEVAFMLVQKPKVNVFMKDIRGSNAVTTAAVNSMWSVVDPAIEIIKARCEQIRKRMMAKTPPSD